MSVVGKKSVAMKKKKLVVELDEDLWFLFGKFAKDENSDRSKKIRIWINEYVNYKAGDMEGTSWQKPQAKLRKKQRSA